MGQGKQNIFVKINISDLFGSSTRSAKSFIKKRDPLDRSLFCFVRIFVRFVWVGCVWCGVGCGVVVCEANVCRFHRHEALGAAGCRTVCCNWIR